MSSMLEREETRPVWRRNAPWYTSEVDEDECGSTPSLLSKLLSSDTASSPRNEGRGTRRDFMLLCGVPPLGFRISCSFAWRAATNSSLIFDCCCGFLLLVASNCAIVLSKLLILRCGQRDIPFLNTARSNDGQQQNFLQKRKQRPIGDMDGMETNGLGIRTFCIFFSKLLHKHQVS